jgi:REP element-mobilizing transposase RayT
MSRDYLPHFFTTSIRGFVPVFELYPQAVFLIVDCLEFLVKNGRCSVHAFVVMKDHFHIVWQPIAPYTGKSLHHSFKSKVGRDIRDLLLEINSDFLVANFASTSGNRRHQIWKISSSNRPLVHDDILQQKIRYIHLNPTKGSYAVVDSPEKYPWSSALAYAQQHSNFTFLTILDHVNPIF